MLAAMSTVPVSAASSRPVATPVRDRGDACPGTLRLHSADDGALARVRLPGGVLGAGQADVLAEAAGRLGDGDLHLTSRGNVQLRGLDPAAATELARLLDAVGLLPSPRHERVRNIVASPLSGLDGLGHADVRGWLRMLDAMLCESDEATALSGRFLFALDDGRGDMTPLGADVTLRAVRPGPSGGAALLRIGGHPTAVRVPAREAPHAALLAAEVFLAAAHGTGAWRVSELPDSEAQLACLIREVAARLGATEEAEAPLGPPGSPVVPGVVAGPEEGPGMVAALSVVAPLGRLTGAQWRGLVDTCREGAGELRLTPWRGVIVPGVAARAAEARLCELDALGLVTGPDSPWLGVTACAGRPGCAKSLADVRAEAARDVAAAGPALRSALLPVHWSGCERRCGHPKGEWADVVALPDGAGFAVSRVDGDGHHTPPVRVAEPSAPASMETLAAVRRGAKARVP